MSLKIVPPFDFVPRISEGIIVGTDKLSLKRLRDIVAGRDTTFPRSRGMAILEATDFPNKHRDFEAVLENEQGISPDSVSGSYKPGQDTHASGDENSCQE